MPISDVERLDVVQTRLQLSFGLFADDLQHGRQNHFPPGEPGQARIRPLRGPNELLHVQPHHAVQADVLPAGGDRYEPHARVVVVRRDDHVGQARVRDDPPLPGPVPEPDVRHQRRPQADQKQDRKQPQTDITALVRLEAQPGPLTR